MNPHHFKSLGIATLIASSLMSLGIAGPEAVKNIQIPAKPAQGKAKPVKFGWGGENNQEFMLDGKPFQIRGAEMHPQRIPREYWRHRIQMAKAMGLNTIAFYVFWNDLEQPGGSFDLKSGNRDIGAFLKMCQEEGMWVLFRPGPYVCGEWDLGGLPSYLFKPEKARLRSMSNPEFMKAQERYLEVMAQVAEPYLAKNGGPILMTQLENEYGSYDWKEKPYMEWLLKFWQKKGFGPFYTSDGTSDYHLNMTLPDVAVGLDPGLNNQHWANANKNNPNVPVFSSETYPGWLRHWGEGNWQPTHSTVNSVKWYMDEGKSFNLFVFHGGTNFGLTAGANGHEGFQEKNKEETKEGKFQPDITSYDYGAPVGENGLPNECYHQMRDIILGKIPNADKVPSVPTPIQTMELPEFTPKFHAGLWDNQLKPVVSKSAKPVHFEAFDQNQGMAIYKVAVPAGPEEKLTFPAMHDYAQVYLNGKKVGVLDRLKQENSIMLPARQKPGHLEILVDTFGHLNFHVSMEFDRKGIYGPVKLGDKELKGWTIHPKPMESKYIVKAPKAEKQNQARSGAHYRAIVNIDNPQDTFLDMSKWVKGYVFVNGVNLGRYLNIGPQLRLYWPAPFMKKGKNVVDIIELELNEPQPIRGMKERNMEPGKVKTENLNNAW